MTPCAGWDKRGILDCRLRTAAARQAGLIIAQTGLSSEIPRADEFKTRLGEIGEVARREASAVDARNGRNHPVGRGHRPTLSDRCAHDVAVGDRSGFRKGEYPVGEPVTP